MPCRYMLNFALCRSLGFRSPAQDSSESNALLLGIYHILGDGKVCFELGSMARIFAATLQLEAVFLGLFAPGAHNVPKQRN
jgi:hypothetical protein